MTFSVDRLAANPAARKLFTGIWRGDLPVREHLDREHVVDTKIHGGLADAVSVLTCDRCARLDQDRLRNGCGRCCGDERRVLETKLLTPAAHHLAAGSE